MIGRQIFGEIRLLVGNEGGFLHKSFIGRAVGGVVGGALGAIPGISQAIGTVRGLVGAIKGPARPVISRTRTARPSLAGAQGKEFGRQLKLGTGEPGGGLRLPGQGLIVPPATGGRIIPPRVHPQDEGPCLPGLIRGPQGNCIAPTSPMGARVLVGEATMGRYGAALIPGSQIVDRATCLRGMQLGNDGLCYNKGQITNKQRMWPAGRKPLLTGGEMNAIRIASRATGRVARTAARLGIEPKAPRRRRAPAGHKAKLVHA